MKILIIRNFPSYISLKNNTYNIQEIGLAKALVRLGHICDVVFWTDKEEEDISLTIENGSIIHIFYRKGFTKLKNTIFNHSYELFEKYDTIQPCEYNQIQSWILAKKFPEKTVIYHGPYYSPFNKRYNVMCRFFDVFFVKRYIKLNTRFIVKSKWAQEFLVSKGIDHTNILLAGVGIDIQMLGYKEDSCDKYVYHRICNDLCKLKILYIGRIEPRRNIIFILEVFYNILKLYPEAMLYIIGKGDSEYVYEVRNKAEKFGIKDSIVWQEQIEQKYLADIYQHSDFFLLPTSYEIFGMVLLEAMYYKNVVLTTSNGGASMLINNGKTGFIIDQLDADIWCRTIIQVFEDSEKKELVQMAASLEVSQSFTWDSLAGKFIEQYSSN